MKKRIGALALVTIMTMGLAYTTAVPVRADNQVSVDSETGNLSGDSQNQSNEDEVVSSAKITEVNLALKGILQVNIYVNPEQETDMSDYTVRFTMGNDKKYQEVDFEEATERNIQSGLRYCYSFLVPANRLNDLMKIELFKDGKRVDYVGRTDGEQTVEGWRLKEDYLDYLITDNPTDLNGERISNVAQSLYQYGKCSAYYVNPDGVEETVITQEVPDLSRYMASVEGDSAELQSLKPATSLFISDACGIRFKLNKDYIDEKSYHVEISDNQGQAVTYEMFERDGDYIYSVPKLSPDKWDHNYTLIVKDSEDNPVARINYSILSYIYRQLNRDTETKTGLKNLLKSMYFYCETATKYVGRADTTIVKFPVRIGNQGYETLKEALDAANLIQEDENNPTVIQIVGDIETGDDTLYIEKNIVIQNVESKDVTIKRSAANQSDMFYVRNGGKLTFVNHSSGGKLSIDNQSESEVQGSVVSVDSESQFDIDGDIPFNHGNGTIFKTNEDWKTAEIRENLNLEDAPIVVMGKNEISVYHTMEDAVNKANATGELGTGHYTLIELTDKTYTLKNECQIQKDTKLYAAAGKAATIIRDVTLTTRHNMFKMKNEASFILGEDTDNKSTILLDCTKYNNRTDTYSGINVEKGKMYVYDNVTFANADTKQSGSAVYVSQGQYLYIHGTKFINNTCNGSSGAAIDGLDNSTIDIEGGALFENNKASSGGAIRLKSNVTLNLGEASFKNNSASNGQGKDIYVSSTAKLNIKDSKKSDVKVVADDIYLDGTKTITVKNNLTKDSNLGLSVSSSYSNSSAAVTKESGVSTNLSEVFRVNSSNYIKELKSDGLYILRGFAARIGSTTYSSLESAISAASSGNTIEIGRNLTISSEIKISKNITISNVRGNHVQLKRSDGYTGNLFLIQGGTVSFGATDGTLTIDGNRQNSPSNTSGSLIFHDYNSKCVVNLKSGIILQNNKVTGTASGVSVNIGTRLNIYDGAVIRNNYSGNYGAGVKVAGTVYMYGGTISGNETAKDGAGLRTESTGVIELYGGTIENNTAATNGGGINVGGGGKLNMYAGAVIQNNKARLGAGVYVDMPYQGRISTFNMYGGIIRNNTATNSGGGVYWDIHTLNYNGGIWQSRFTKTGGEITGNTAPKYPDIY